MRTLQMPLSSYSHQQLSGGLSAVSTHLYRSHSVSTLNNPTQDAGYLKSRKSAHRLPVQMDAGADDDGDDVINNSRISLYLRALRGDKNSNINLSVRGDLDSFAKTLDTVQVKGQTSNDISDAKWSAVQCQDELLQLERLIEKTFGGQWRTRNTTSVGDTIPKLTSSISAGSEVFSEPLESSSMAALAVRWAEERRRRVERDIASSKYEVNVPTPDLVSRSRLLNNHQSLLELNDAMYSDNLSPRCRRTMSATEQFGDKNHELTRYNKTNSVKPEMSEARRKIRNILCKSKGDPSYFENKSYDDEYLD